MMEASALTRSRAFLVQPLMAVVLTAEAAHIFIVCALRHPLMPSNLFQLFFPLLAVVVSLHQRAFSPDAVTRRCWSAMAMAFGIWATAQALYLVFFFFPEVKIAGVRLDDALWVLFGLPILLAIHTNGDELDRVQWLDRLQALAFFVVLYAVVFLHSSRLSLTTVYLIQNVALVFCCLMRLPTCTHTSERRFFARLTTFLVIYSSLETVGDLLYLRGWDAGTPADLVWTIPIAAYLVLVLHDAKAAKDQPKLEGMLVTAFRRMRGVGVAALAFLSVGISSLLATHHLVLGGLCLVACFALFALRTNAREHAWEEAHGQLEQTVLLDALTGLGNRIQLRNCLNQRLAATPSTGGHALLFVDLDSFKTINDSLGHAVGDRLLLELAERLRASAPRDAQVCRIGGDEFVILTSVEDAGEAERAGLALLEALRSPYRLGEHTVRCSASIGVVLAKAGEPTDDLLRTADHAMYRAKQLGKDRVQFFDEPLLAQINSRWQLEADLRGCVERGAIEVAFQPILSVGGGEITGFEALARWNHPERGQISPEDFIPLAEDTGLILSLGAQVLGQACSQITAWNRAWNTRFSVSVNVSPRQFADSSFLATLMATLDRTGMDPHLLRLEITESVLLVNEASVRKILSQVRACGIHLSLDDFGTGYSSLSFLLNLPVDEVKVDRSFVSDMHRDPQRRELVRTVIQLGHSLGKRVVAEGVETEQELQELAAMGCECAQGWLISRPLSAEMLETDLPAIAARNARTAQGNQHSLAFMPQTRRPEGWLEVLRSAVPERVNVHPVRSTPI